MKIQVKFVLQNLCLLAFINLILTNILNTIDKYCNRGRDGERRYANKEAGRGKQEVSMNWRGVSRHQQNWLLEINAYAIFDNGVLDKY